MLTRWEAASAAAGLRSMKRRWGKVGGAGVAARERKRSRLLVGSTSTPGIVWLVSGVWQLEIEKWDDECCLVSGDRGLPPSTTGLHCWEG